MQTLTSHNIWLSNNVSTKTTTTTTTTMQNANNKKDCYHLEDDDGVDIDVDVDVDVYNKMGSATVKSGLAPAPPLPNPTAPRADHVPSSDNGFNNNNITCAFFADLFEDHRLGKGGSGNIIADTIAIEIIADNAKPRRTAPRSLYFPSLKQDKETKSISRWHSIVRQNQSQSQSQNRGRGAISRSSIRLPSQLFTTMNNQTVENNEQHRPRLSSSLSPPSRNTTNNRSSTSTIRRIEMQVASSLRTFIESDYGMITNYKTKIKSTQKNKNEIDHSAHSTSSSSSAGSGSLHWGKFNSIISSPNDEISSSSCPSSLMNNAPSPMRTSPYVLRSQHIIVPSTPPSSSSSSSSSLPSSSRRRAGRNHKKSLSSRYYAVGRTEDTFKQSLSNQIGPLPFVPTRRPFVDDVDRRPQIRRTSLSSQPEFINNKTIIPTHTHTHIHTHNDNDDAMARMNRYRSWPSPSHDGRFSASSGTTTSHENLLQQSDEDDDENEEEGYL
jgi:hypothetical protein